MFSQNILNIFSIIAKCKCSLKTEIIRTICMENNIKLKKIQHWSI